MSEDKTFWFHCGRCGALFQSEPGQRDGRVCSVCGADPCPPVVETAVPAAAGAGLPAKRTGQSKRGSRKNKRRHLMPVLMLGWTLVLVLIVLVARKFWSAPEPQSVKTPSEKPASNLTEEDMRLMQSAAEECSRVFGGFLVAGTPEERNQYVLSPVDTASRMARFYSQNPMPAINPEKLRATETGTLHLPQGPAYEARWESTDGNIYDTVFRRENDEWRLDWDHFSRYSDYPWALFIAGSGPDAGEFRLLARERLAEERKTEPTISLVLYAPRFGSPREVGSQSPEFLVPRATQAGQLLDAAFKLARGGGRVFGSKVGEINPDGMIRVRVKVRRYEEEMERKFEITDVVACHWLAVDDPGVKPIQATAPEKESEAAE